MKKSFLAIAIVTISFAACTGNGTKTKETTSSDTSTIVTKDTMQVIKDTTVKTTITVDTSKVKADTTNKK